MSITPLRHLCFLIGVGLWLPFSALFAQNFASIQPTPQQSHWQDLEFGVIVHFGTNTFLDREWGDGHADPKVFDPDHLDAAQWVRASQAAGARYMILVAKHHDGFALWPTDQSDYSVKSSPWQRGKGDVVQLASDAARKAGMAFGIYLSPWDRHEPRYANSVAYDKFYMAQMDELISHYGPLVEWWLDGAGSAGHVYDFDKYLEELRAYQANTLVFADMALLKYGDIRWVGTEDGHIRDENWNPIDRNGYLRWRPVEVDTPLHKLHWFWHPNDEASLKSVDELMDIWESSVGRGGQLLLGIAPDRHGLLPQADVERLAAFGKALQARYGDAANLARHHVGTGTTSELAFDGNLDTFWAAPEGSHDATLELDLGKPTRFDRTLSMEWLDAGQQVRDYAIEVWQDGQWKAVARAQAIGHEKVDIFTPVTAQKLRLHILSAAGTARIREFKVFDASTH